MTFLTTDQRLGDVIVIDLIVKPNQREIYPLWTAEQICQQFKISVSTLKRWRKEGFLACGSPYVIELPGGSLRYNIRLIEDRLVNRDDDFQHARAVENYLKTLPSNENLKSGRRAGK
jgi:hypothetical protein